MRRLHRTRMRIGLTVALLLVSGGGGPVDACQEVFDVLGRRSFQAHQFGRSLYKMSRELSGSFTTEGKQLPEARFLVNKGLEVWLEIYMRYYQSPPTSLKHDGWRGQMDSVAAQIGRLRKAVLARDEAKGHELLQLLQRTLAGFTGRTSRIEPGGVGNMLHQLETLELVKDGDEDATKERLALAAVLRHFYQEWESRCGDDCDAVPAIQALGPAIDTYEQAARESQGPKHQAALRELRGALTRAQSARIEMVAPPQARADLPAPEGTRSGKEESQ